jgi:hypothetical protein
VSDPDYATFPIRGKLANGLYGEELVVSPESVVFRLYASRPFEPSDLAAYAFADHAGTTYAIALPAFPVEGRFTLAFSPGPPRGWRSLSLSRPGHALIIARPED